MARFVSSLAFGVLWTVTGRGPAVLVFAVLLLLAIPVAWWLLRGVTPVVPADDEAVDAA